MKKLLVVVDMQNDFIDGSLGTKEAAAIVTAVKEKIELCKAAGTEVVFTLDTHDENYLNTAEGRKLPVKHCIKGTAGWELAPVFNGYEGLRFEKPAFASPALADYVKENDFDDIELVGLCTDICVISNALLIKATTPEAAVCVDSVCCAGVTPESHRNALEAMRMCQVDIAL